MRQLTREDGWDSILSREVLAGPDSPDIPLRISLDRVTQGEMEVKRRIYKGIVYNFISV
jgi:hypothetical protein